jgi:GNAT superfamily N-acetyltransferase
MLPNPNVLVREYREPTDGRWAEALLNDQLSGRLQARRGELIDVLTLHPLVAEDADGPAGLLCYSVDEDGWELAAMVTARQGRGTGTALVQALLVRAREAGCGRVWVVTTNDNMGALRFYQRRGFRLRTLRPGAVDEARRLLKPSIPDVGQDGIPLRDELELELPLGARTPDSR